MHYRDSLEAAQQRIALLEEELLRTTKGREDSASAADELLRRIRELELELSTARMELGVERANREAERQTLVLERERERAMHRQMMEMEGAALRQRAAMDESLARADRDRLGAELALAQRECSSLKARVLLLQDEVERVLEGPERADNQAGLARLRGALERSRRG